MTLYESTRFLHAGIGAIGLITFWLAGLSRKGSPVHRAAGKIYLVAMAVVLAAAVPLDIRIFQSGETITAAFLAFLLLLTITSVWVSWRAIRDKRDFARFVGPVYRVLAVINAAAGVAILGLGLTRGAVLLIAFSSVGLIGAFNMARNILRGQRDARWWLREHFTAMLANGIATHIAFLSIGLPRLVPEWQGPVLFYGGWLGPLAVAVIARIALGIQYRAPAPRPAVAAGPRA